MSEAIHIFVYDQRPVAGAGVTQETVRRASVQGTLFEIEGVGPALLLSGYDQVPGEIRRVAAAALEELDARARVREGVHRRVGVRVGPTPCWTWVAGPAIASRLVLDSRVRRILEDEA